MPFPPTSSLAAEGGSLPFPALEGGCSAPGHRARRTSPSAEAQDPHGVTHPQILSQLTAVCSSWTS